MYINHAHTRPQKLQARYTGVLVLCSWNRVQYGRHIAVLALLLSAPSVLSLLKQYNVVFDDNVMHAFHRRQNGLTLLTVVGAATVQTVATGTN
jgi:hypothetical protein